MIEENYIKNRHGLKMAVRLNIDERRTKLAFLEHGLGARKEYPHMLVLEEFFAKNGYNVVNLDACNSNNKSDKSEDGITFTGHYQDLEDVIEWAKLQKFYTEPFALAGQSLGAQSVVMYAGKYPEKVNLLITCSFPWIDGKIEVRQNKRTKDILEKGFYDQISRSSGQVLRIKKNYLDDLEKYNFENIIKNIKADCFVIDGLLDTEYHIENSKKLYEMLNCPKHLYLLPNVPHDLANTPETKQIFESALADIFEKKLNVKKFSEIVGEYLKIFPNERKRVDVLQNYLKTAKDGDICDWNNSNGHITCGAFLYSKENRKFLTLYHKDLQMYLYAGGHLESSDKNPLERATLELVEESGIKNSKNMPICKSNIFVPIDIDTHTIPYNAKYNMPEHNHFDFRYLFVIDDMQNVNIDQTEMGGYKWISEQELAQDKNFGKIIKKLELIIKNLK